jgi:hypothetical protein
MMVMQYVCVRSVLSCCGLPPSLPLSRAILRMFCDVSFPFFFFRKVRMGTLVLERNV